jgi:hypothetical protein
VAARLVDRLDCSTASADHQNRKVVPATPAPNPSKPMDAEMPPIDQVFRSVHLHELCTHIHGHCCLSIQPRTPPTLSGSSSQHGSSLSVFEELALRSLLHCGHAVGLSTNEGALARAGRCLVGNNRNAFLKMHAGPSIAGPSDQAGFCRPLACIASARALLWDDKGLAMTRSCPTSRCHSGAFGALG